MAHQRLQSPGSLVEAADNHKTIPENMYGGTVIGAPKGEAHGYPKKKCNLAIGEGLDFRQGKQSPGLRESGREVDSWGSFCERETGWL